MKKVIIALIIIVFITGAFYFFYSSNNNEVKVESKNVKQTTTIKEIDAIEVFGTVDIKQKQSILFDFPVRIKQLYVSNGQEINEGDILFSLDMSDILYEIEQKEKKLQVAETKLRNLNKAKEVILKQIENEVMINESLYEKEKKELKEKKDELINENSPDFKKLLNQLEINKKDLKDLEKELKDKEHLLKVEAITQKQLDDFILKVEKKQDSITGIQLSLDELRYKKEREIDNLEKSIQTRENTINSLKLKIEKTEYEQKEKSFMQTAEVASLKNELDYLNNKIDKEYLQGNEVITNIKNGIVYDIRSETGDLIEEGYKICSIMDLHDVIVIADVPEEFIKDVKKNAEVTIVPLADPEREYHGKVVRILDMAEKRGGETIVPVEITIDDLDKFLLPNFNVDVKIKKI